MRSRARTVLVRSRDNIFETAIGEQRGGNATWQGELSGGIPLSFPRQFRIIGLLEENNGFMGWIVMIKKSNGSFKKKRQQNCSSVFCWSLLLFYSGMVRKQ